MRKLKLRDGRVNNKRPALSPDLKRVKIDLRVNPETFFMLKARGAQEGKGRAASPGAQAARVLDRWQALKPSERGVEIAEHLEEQEGRRRVQATAWVLPATARTLYSLSIAKAPSLRSQSRNAGLIVERWAAREEALQSARSTNAIQAALDSGDAQELARVI